jgi:hypothetical protein
LAIFVELCHFCDLWRRNRNDVVENGSVELLDGAQRARGDVIQARDDFWNRLERRSDATGVNALNGSKSVIFRIQIDVVVLPRGSCQL